MGRKSKVPELTPKSFITVITWLCMKNTPDREIERIEEYKVSANNRQISFFSPHA
jgi:hypothetical protein